MHDINNDLDGVLLKKTTGIKAIGIEFHHSQTGCIQHSLCCSCDNYICFLSFLGRDLVVLQDSIVTIIALLKSVYIHTLKSACFS